ncbi:hypothetical protein [Aldersonia kunmingensis]|uniref:hypothetical protein n=1 Tax=Aldersonia kunmingensis TaxID=408066 RepID=UPI0008352EB7|nr:hypothetical protein [Aldersonia kunmingensis]
MATLSTPGHEADHATRHPMGWVAFTLVLLIIPALGLTVTNLAESNTGAATASAIALAATILGATTIYTVMARRLHQSPLLPEDSTAEKDRYLENYRRG